METNTTYTFRDSIACGGSIQGETTEDVIADIVKAVPSATFKCVDVAPGHTGNWPIYDITISGSDLSKLAVLFDFENIEDMMVAYGLV